MQRVRFTKAALATVLLMTLSFVACQKDNTPVTSSNVGPGGTGDAQVNKLTLTLGHCNGDRY